MPPQGQVSFAPECACLNFPLCGKSQTRTLDSQTGTRTRKSHCSECLQNPVCREEGCAEHAPSNGKLKGKKFWTTHGLCAAHARDLKYREICECWTFCSNRDAGCKQFAIKRGGDKCFACKNSCLPCANAPHGCPRHVVTDRSKPGLRECIGHKNTPCPFRQRHESQTASRSESSTSQMACGSSGSTVAFAPERSCANYPFCTRTQQSSRSKGNVHWESNCSHCLQNPMCTADFCTNHVPPSHPQICHFLFLLELL